MAFRERGREESIHDEPKRLSDFLMESDEETLAEINSKCEIGDPSVKSGSGLNRLSKLLWSGRRAKPKKDEEKKRGEGKRGIQVRDFSPELSKLSVSKSGNASLTMGMGIGLFLLLSKSTSEYSKMADLYKQMKTLLGEIKQEFQNKSRDCSTASDFSCDLYKIGDEVRKSEKEDDQCAELDQMEAELEIEFERMRSNVSEGSSSRVQKHRNQNIPPEWIDFCQNFGSNFEESEEAWEDDSQNYGVSPLELERRLHELIHQRQQERIEELQYHMHLLERKLLEKEREINRWKGIAATSLKCE